MTTYYSSYAGCLGTWTYMPGWTDAAFMQKLTAMNGLFSYIGYPNYLNPIDGHPNTGSIRPVKLSNITDGTGNTIAFSKQAHGMYSQQVSSDGISISTVGIGGSRPTTETPYSQPSTRSTPGIR